MKVLISGAGIAGPTLAYWLARYGFEPTLLEVAPRLRSGGYLVDFWGGGYDIAEKMGLLGEIYSKGYKFKEVRVVDERGKRIAGFPVDALSRMTHGRFVTVPRTALAAAIFCKMEDKVETIFGDSVDRIEQSESRVQVTFKHRGTREFDLVVGADGLYSRVRELVFGEQRRFEKYLGYKVAAFQVKGYGPRDELVSVMYTEVNQQLVRLSLRNDGTMFIFTFRDDDPGGSDDVQSQKALLRKRFGTSGWECPRVLNALDNADDFYFDRVSQIRMESRSELWSQGRVTLVGDAASCVSLMAGQGTSLAMMAAYILAGELLRCGGDYAAAFRRYQELFAPFVLKKQQSALYIAGAFAPRSKLSMFLRNQLFKLMAIPWIADLAVGRDLADKITLPDYSKQREAVSRAAL